MSDALHLVREVINRGRGRSPKWSLAVAVTRLGSVAAKPLA